MSEVKHLPTPKQVQEQRHKDLVTKHDQDVKHYMDKLESTLATYDGKNHVSCRVGFGCSDEVIRTLRANLTLRGWKVETSLWPFDGTWWYISAKEPSL